MAQDGDTLIVTYSVWRKSNSIKIDETGIRVRVLTAGPARLHSCSVCARDGEGLGSSSDLRFRWTYGSRSWLCVPCARDVMACILA